MAQTPCLHFIICPLCVAGLQGPSEHLRKVLYVLRPDKDREPACDGAWGPSCPEVGDSRSSAASWVHHLWGVLPVSKPGWRTGHSAAKECSPVVCLGFARMRCYQLPPVDSRKPRGQQQVSLLRDCLMLSTAEHSQQGRHPSGPTLEQKIRTNFKILDNPLFTNKQFYLNPAFKILLPHLMLVEASFHILFPVCVRRTLALDSAPG